jgi:hypothetical protein
MNMSKILNAEQLRDRADDLVSHNGIQRVFVTLDDMTSPSAFAELEVEFYNAVALADIINDITALTKQSDDIFSIAGGSRIPGDADKISGIVRVTDAVPVAGENKIILRVEPVGDYSTYTLQIIDSSYAFDPLFASVDFKFRPGCFNTNCVPLSDYKAANDEPVIDYLAKDFHSFKHLLINAMRDRVPNWQPTSEADLDQVIIDLIAADADEISDYQDRMMNEAYLGRARKRVSLARYGRLMDYHIHQGNQASSWLALQVNADFMLDKSLAVWSGHDWKNDDAIIFASQHDANHTQDFFVELNELRLYTWGNIVTALEAGAFQADVHNGITGNTEIQANNLRDILRSEAVQYLLIEQKLNPGTGTQNGVDKTARQVVQLLDADTAAESVEDPVTGEWFVRINWHESDQLQRRYCFVSQCPDLPPEDGISQFHGNLVWVTQGRPHITHFRPEGEPLGISDDTLLEKIDYLHYETVDNQQLLRSKEKSSAEQLPVLARIPHRFLAYQNTQPGGEDRTRAALKVEASGFTDPWDEQSDLIESEADDAHFIVETDELERSIIYFGNNINGRALPEAAEITCSYQIGRGVDGNIGSDTLRGFDDSASGFPAINQLWNPLDITDGRAPELRDEIIRRVPEAYRARQLRAITLEDYVKRAEELDVVSHAHARYAWAGSWRTVRVSIDLKAGFSWDEEKFGIKAHLDAVRLIGEDLEVREARFVSLDIMLRLCAHSDYWPEDLAHELAVEFSDTYTADGRQGFFHPDLWTFGQTIHASQVIGRALAVTGVERVLLLSTRRWYTVKGPSTDVLLINPADLINNEIDRLEVEPWEIIQVASDPNHLEKGRIQWVIEGGRG